VVGAAADKTGVAQHLAGQGHHIDLKRFDLVVDAIGGLQILHHQIMTQHRIDQILERLVVGDQLVRIADHA